MLNKHLFVFSVLYLGLFYGASVMAMDLKSTAFKQGETIPKVYTCDGDNTPPPLQWSSIPDKTKSLVLIVEDPDAPAGVWDHWVVFNIPPTTQALESGNIPKGIVIGRNSSDKNSYQGPCPPDREHRYFFKLSALDSVLTLDSGATKADVENAMKGHVIDSTELMGKYNRSK